MTFWRRKRKRKNGGLKDRHKRLKNHKGGWKQMRTVKEGKRRKKKQKEKCGRCELERKNGRRKEKETRNEEKVRRT